MVSQCNIADQEGNWLEVIALDERMLKIANENPNFAKVNQIDIAWCYGNLAHAYYECGSSLKTGEYLLLKAEMVKQIKPIDLSTRIFLTRVISKAYKQLAEYYDGANKLTEAVTAWTEAVKANLTLIEFNRPNNNFNSMFYIDSTRCKAGYVGSMSPIADEEEIRCCLRGIGGTLFSLLKSDPEEAARLYQNAFPIAEKIVTRSFKFTEGFSMMLGYDFFRSLGKNGIERSKEKYTELMKFLNYYGEHSKFCADMGRDIEAKFGLLFQRTDYDEQ